MLSYKLSLTLFGLLGYGEQVFFQDSLTYNSPKVDLIVGDFSGIIEKDIYSLIMHHGNNIINGGFLIGVFDEKSVNEKTLVKYSKDLNNIWKLFGLLKLPKGILKNQNKSIVIFQKTGIEIFQPKRFLLVDLPEFSNKDDMKIVISQINDWFKNTEFYKLGEK